MLLPSLNVPLKFCSPLLIINQEALVTHEQWLQSIRQVVWERADTENKTVPSVESLILHWKRIQWVLNMWHQATSNYIQLYQVNTIQIQFAVLYHNYILFQNIEHMWLEEGGW